MNTLVVESIGGTFLSIGSFELEVVSDAHELNAIGSKFLFKPLPNLVLRFIAMHLRI